MSRVTIREALAAGRPLAGPIVSIEAPAVAEALALSGWDWLFIDLEHSPLTAADAQRLLQAVAGRAYGVLRLSDATEAAIKKALDTGCDGIIVPQVNTADQARAVVRAARYAPLGARGVGLARAQGYGTSFDDYMRRANDDIAVVVQAEHADALPTSTRSSRHPVSTPSSSVPTTSRRRWGSPARSNTPMFRPRLSRSSKRAERQACRGASSG